MIAAISHEAADAARARQKRLLKPAGSLGRLEELAIWMAGVTGEPIPEVRAEVVIAAADHGVAAEGVSAYPQEVTGQMLGAFLSGASAISVLAEEAGVEIAVIDAGVANPPAALESDPRLVRCGIRSSANLAEAAALGPDDVERAVETGRQIAAEAKANGTNILVGGDMGIANTTPATCLAAWLTDQPTESLCGRGTGIDDLGLDRKRRVVARALERHAPVIQAPRDALRLLGGGEIAVLCGLALGAGEQGMGYVCDGVIATAAAAVAVAEEPRLRDRLVAGHRSPEPAHTALLSHLELEPILDLRMRLGEASGAAAALLVLRLACALHGKMATFEEAGVATGAPG